MILTCCKSLYKGQNGNLKKKGDEMSYINLVGLRGIAFAGAQLVCKGEDPDGKKVTYNLPLQPGRVDLSVYAALTFDFVVDVENVYLTEFPGDRLRAQRNEKKTDTSAVQEYSPSQERIEDMRIRQIAGQLFQQMETKRKVAQARVKADKVPHNPHNEELRNEVIEDAANDPKKLAKEKPEEQPADGETAD